MLLDHITTQDWNQMTTPERDELVFDTIGIRKEQLEAEISQWEHDEGKKPNALFLSFDILADLSRIILLRKVCGLTVIPMESERNQFIIGLEDPWAWGDLFYKS